MRSKFFRKRNKFIKRVMTFINHPLFWYLTIIGNGMILVGSLLLYQFEAESAHNQSLTLIDSLLWSTGIITTVGYADYIPHTLPGKITVLGLMLFGTIFLWSYMAFFVSALLSPALNSLEKEVQEVEKEVSDLKIEEQKNQYATRSMYEK